MRYLRFLFITFVAATLILLNSCNVGLNKTQTQTQTQTQIDPGHDQPKTELSYLVALGLMKGHLSVAHELIEQGTPDQAEPHLGHPIEEIYGQIEEPLQTHKIPEFKTTLIKLHELAKYAPANPGIKAGYDASIASINTAINSIPLAERQSPQFVIKAMGEILQTMADEYNAAVANDKIVARIEYQDSRGFMTYVEELYGTISPAVSQQSAAAHKVITANLDQLKKAFHSANPPKSPLLQPEKVYEIVKTIQEAKLT
jgi:hypothetical protein